MTKREATFINKSLSFLEQAVLNLLYNAIKYSRASRITVGARHSTAGYSVWVEDNGVGLPDPLSEGRGLSNMRRRARDIGGSLRVERAASGVGTVVELSLPPTTGIAPD